MRAFSALLSAALLPLLVRAAFHSNDTACTRHYTVQAGDTCDRIGQKTLTSTYQILAFNLLSAGADCYTLEIGTRLCLGRYGNDCQFVHQATNQDTCESIANAYGITTERLQSNNPSLDCNIVYEGLMLCVSAGSIRPPADRSINATDVRAAREQARQMWLVQQQDKAAPVETVQLPKPHSALSHQKHQSSTRKHTSDGHQHHKLSSHSDKSSYKQHSHNGASKSGLDRTSSNSAASQPQQRSAQDDVPPPQSYDQGEVEMVQDLLASTPLGSNHTPQHQDAAHVIAASGSTLQRRHRSLSSRSHHHKSHTS